MPDFNEIVSIQWDLSQPRNELQAQYDLTLRYSQLLKEVGSESASAFAKGMITNLDAVTAKINALIAQQEALKSSSARMTSTTGSGGLESLNIEIDEAKRRADLDAIRGSFDLEAMRKYGASVRGSTEYPPGQGIPPGFQFAPLSGQQFTGVSVDTLSANRALGELGANNADLIRGYDFADQLSGLRNLEREAIKAGKGMSDLEREMRGLPPIVEEAGKKIDFFSTQLGRHISWIAQTIAIYSTMALAVKVVGDLATEWMRLESVQSRLGFINPGAAAGVTEQFRAAAQYGITPEQSAPGIMLGAQLGASRQQEEQARQIALVFGTKEYTNALNELIQTQARADAAGTKQVNTLGFLASAMQPGQGAPGSLEQYFDSLQYGIELQEKFGLTAEQSGLVLVRTSALTEQSASQISNIFGRVAPRLSDKDVQEQLKERFGIEAGDPSQMFRQIAAASARFSQTGARDRQDELLDVLVGGGLQGPQTKREFRIALEELNQAYTSATQPLSDFSEAVDSVANTSEAAANRMKAAWANMLLSLGDTGIAKGTLEFLTRRFDITAGLATGVGDIFSNLSGIGKLSYGGLEASALKETGTKDIFAAYGKLSSEALVGDAFESASIAARILAGALREAADTVGRSGKELARDIAGVSGPPTNVFGGRGGGVGAGSRGAWTPPEFGGFRDLPEGTDWNRFVTDVRSFEKQIKQQVPEYEIDQKTIAFYDESLGQFRKLTADSEAIRFASERQKELLEQITGVFNVPAGGEVLVPFSALQAGFVPSDRYNGMSGGARTDSAVKGRVTGYGTKLSGEDDDGDMRTTRDISVSGMTRNMLAQITRGASETREQDGRAGISRIRELQEMGSADKRANLAMSAAAGAAASLNLTVPIQVIIDGQIVQRSLQRRMSRSLTNRARGGSAALLLH